MSVANQTYPNIDHFIVADGPTRVQAVIDAAGKLGPNASIYHTPVITGAHGFNGHRIYGAMPFLVNAEYVCYLDEDNRFAPEHIATLVALMLKHALDWSYSLRRIISKRGRYMCNDDCDSLGLWGSWYGNQNHIDTNCYLLKRDVAIAAASIWHRKGYQKTVLDPDKALCRWLLQHHLRGFTTGLYTVDYRLGSSKRSVKKDYFEYGNKTMKRLFREFPWRAPLLEAIDERINYRRVVSACEPNAAELSRNLRTRAS